MSRIALFGGSFDPIHNGHLIVAQTVVEKIRLDKVVFVPSYRSPHKKDQGAASAKHRLAMARLAVKGNSLFEVSDYEYRKTGISYSVDTVRHVKESLPKRSKIYLILGADTFEFIHAWKAVDELMSMVNFVVVNRPGYKFRQKRPHVSVLMPDIGISSTSIRRRLKQKKDIRYLVPDAVRRYIERNRLYQ